MVSVRPFLHLSKPLAHKAQRKEWSRTKDCNVQFRGISPRQRYQLAPALPSADMQRYRHSKQGQAARAARNRSPLFASLHSADAPHTKPMLVVRTRAASKQHPAAAQRQVQSSSNAQQTSSKYVKGEAANWDGQTTSSSVNNSCSTPPCGSTSLLLAVAQATDHRDAMSVGIRGTNAKRATKASRQRAAARCSTAAMSVKSLTLPWRHAARSVPHAEGSMLQQDMYRDEPAK